MSIVLPNLPYAINALEPHMSRETLEYHYGKHHQAYVDNLRKLIANSPLENMSLAEIIIHEKEGGAIFNNAAQIWNHTFFWNCLTGDSEGLLEGELAEAIKRDFESFDKFQKIFTQKALSNFGSGWTWLVKKPDGKLEIINTSNAQTPACTENKALLTCDVWEHAYYIDHRNSRPNYLEAFWHIVNWKFVAKNYNKF